MGKHLLQVELAFYRESLSQQLQNYQFGQTKFSSHPVQALESIADTTKAYPIVVFVQDAVAGFFILEELPRQSDYGTYDHALLFRAFSLDVNYRGKGLSKIVMEALFSFVRKHFSSKTMIVLGANAVNFTAIGLYKRMGYRDTARTFIGKKGKQYVFEKSIV
ncbi:GNAT family N-acetyltransferase [Sporolactobacillus shoreicorticis]|uniref:GNAT family N-acetyltransferase n=1 Tax=Sporolactobacillus shoreicorticis TaxID=1923877 RepID=A0ABW5S3Q3_9BACL|nr:GNAT family N-acetyltransferase [Sporolactobacillus shoreicorticis]MCO7126434.1 GNAT family N-acetyltransferase [Sporolactobacillus shoreicorticis]